MSQAFLNGYRASRGMGMGDVRTPQMRGGDQANTVSGNPGLAYNMPRMSTGAIASGAQQMQANDPNMFAAQRQAMQGMPPQAPGFAGQAMYPGNAGNAIEGGQMPAKPMRVRMPIMQTGAIASQAQQMPVHTQPVQRAQYARPALSSINNMGRRVFAQ